MAKADRYPGGSYSKAALAKKARGETIGQDWAKWLKLWKNWFVCSIWLADDNDEPDVQLYLPARENYLIKPLSIVLTNYTEAEIIAVRELFNEMFDLAQPICKIRDERAAAEYEAGEDADKRLYREIPNIFTRSWAVGLNGQSLLQRLKELPSAKRIAARANEANGRSSDGVAESVAGSGGPGDDDAAPSEPADL